MKNFFKYIQKVESNGNYWYRVYCDGVCIIEFETITPMTKEVREKVQSFVFCFWRYPKEFKIEQCYKAKNLWGEWKIYFVETLD